MFLDKVRIKVSSGRGGNGIVAWHREKYVDKGGPAGGDGGRGGDVYIVGNEDMSTLLDFKYKSIFKAQNGANGQPKNQHGKGGKDLYIKVPVGTVVFHQTGQSEKSCANSGWKQNFQVGSESWNQSGRSGRSSGKTSG